MLQMIHADGDVKKFIRLAKDRNNPFRLMGFGHRVYKTYDPRAAIIKKECDAYLERIHYKDPLLDVAREVEEAALTDPYFVERNLYPNVDFYTGILYRALGIPENMFTVMFALARLPGWVAHWKEMIGGETKIVAPDLHRQDPGRNRRSDGEPRASDPLIEPATIGGLFSDHEDRPLFFCISPRRRVLQESVRNCERTECN